MLYAVNNNCQTDFVQNFRYIKKKISLSQQPEKVFISELI